MRPIDEYIVRMQLENEEFKRNARETVGIFESMKAMFGRQDSVGALDAMAIGMETLVSKFDTGSVMIRRVLDNIVDYAIQAGRRMGQAITTPLVEAGKRRALTIEQAQFQFQGLGMNVSDTMASANEAVLGTAFGLDEAAMAAAMFGASGMEAGDEMTTALRAISGVAAMAGSSFGDISNVFTSVAGNGRVMGNDLLRLSTRGVNAAATMADYYTEVGDGAEITEAKVREMVTAGEVSFEDFAAAMDGAFGEHATKSSETYTGALSLVNSAIQRIGATMFAQGFVDKKNLFNTMQPQINKLHEALKPLINSFNEYKTIVTGRLATRIEQMNMEPLIQSTQKFVDMGGMKSITDSIESMGRVAKTIFGSMNRGFKNTFESPTLTGALSMFEGMEAGFKSFADMFIRNSHNITSAFEGVFSIMKLGIDIGMSLLGIFLEMPPKDLGDSIFEVAGNLGKMAIAFTDSVREGEGLPSILDAISSALGFFGGMFSSFAGGLSTVFDGLKPTLMAIWEILKEITKFSAGLISDIFGDVTGVDVLNVAAAGGILSLANKAKGFFDEILTVFSGFFDGLSIPQKRLTDLLDSVTDSLTAMTNNIKAKTLLTIAGAVGILAVSLKLLESLSLGDITKGLSAIAGSLTAVWITFMLLNRIDMGSMKMTKTVAGLIGIATSVSIFAGAIKKMAVLDPERVEHTIRSMIGIMVAMTINLAAMSKIKGLEVGMATMIGSSIAIRILVTALKPLSKLDPDKLTQSVVALGVVMLEMALFSKLMANNPISIFGAIGTTIMAGAIVIMAGAVTLIGSIDGNRLAKGLGGLGIILLEIALFSKLVNPRGTIKTGIAMNIMAIAIKNIAGSVKSLGDMSFEDMMRGLTGIAIILTQLGLFYTLVPTKRILRISTAMVILANAIETLVPPLVSLGNMSSEEMAMSLGGLAVVLTQLIVAMKFASGGIGGAIALMLLTTALKPLVVVLKELAKMSSDELVKSILGLAGALGVLGIAGKLIGPAIPGLLGLSLALVAIAGAFALLGLGAELLASGLSTFSKLSTIALDSVVLSMGIMLDGLEKAIPQLGRIFVEMTVVIFEALADAVPRLVVAGLDLVLGLLRGIADGMGDIIEAGFDIVMILIDAITEYIPDLIMAGVEMIIALISGMADAMEENGHLLVTEFMRLFGEILILVIDAGAQVISALFGWIPGVNSAMEWVGDNATDAIREAFKAPEVGKEKGEDFADSIRQTEGDAYKAGHGIGEEADRGAAYADFLSRGAEKGMDFTKGVTSQQWVASLAGEKISGRARSGASSVSLYGTGENVGYGFSSGMKSQGVMSSLWSTGKSLFARARSAVESAAGIKSPSREMMKDGVFFAEGFALGISDGGIKAEDSADSMVNQVMDAVRSKADLFAELLNSEFNLTPTITPVLDMSNFDTGVMDSTFRDYANAVNSNSNSRYGAVDSHYNQNGNNKGIDRGKESGSNGQSIEYHAHLEVHGALPKSTIDRMARDLDSALKRMNDRNKIGRGEVVTY